MFAQHTTDDSQFTHVLLIERIKQPATKTKINY